MKRFLAPTRRLTQNQAFVSNVNRNYATVLLCEHNKQKVSSSTFSALTAAKSLNKDITVVVAGTKDDKSVAETMSKASGVSKVVLVTDDSLSYQSPESTQKVLEQVIADDTTHVVAPHSMWGKNVLPRLGAVYDVQPITDVISIEDDKHFVRPVYAGDALTKVESLDEKVLITTRVAAFDKEQGTQDAVEIEETTLSTKPTHTSTFVKSELSESDRPELSDASIVISGGRGMKNGENFEILEKFADQVGAAVGASRAAVDAGWVPNDMQVGQTGKVVAPDLYIACGISGQIQHVAGMKDAKCIVAINKDEDAPFFQIADYGLVADLFTAVPELTKLVESNKE